MNVFSVNSDVPDVEMLLASVAQTLREWEGGRTPPLDLSYVLGQTTTISQQVAQLRSQANLDSQAIIHSTRPRVGPWIIRFQHLVRRFTWWFTEPIVQQIRLFQIQSTMTLGKLAQNEESLAKHVDTLNGEVEALRQRLHALETQLAEKTTVKQQKS